MTAMIEQLGGWSWWILGLILLGMEILLPGTFFLWFGVSALVIGVAALLVDWPWQAQIIAFVVLAIVLLIVGRRYFKGWAGRPSDDAFLNDRGARLVGSVHVLGEPIVDGQGRVRIDDSNWRIAGPNLPSGRRIRVVAVVDGAVLRVEPAD